jgi:GrpB-like predicted nucleotidyltransferase (UPF0157 family)
MPHEPSQQLRRTPLGLPSGVVRLCKHDSQWGQLYLTQEVLIRKAIGCQLLDLQHVGSTCIPNIKAKPIVDILMGIESLPQGLSLVEPLSRIQFEYLANALVPGHLVFAKGSPRTYLLHVVEHTGAAWMRVIAFRNILLCSPPIAARYEALKVALSRQFHDDRAGYAEAKTEFIDRILKTGGQL